MGGAQLHGDNPVSSFTASNTSSGDITLNNTVAVDISGDQREGRRRRDGDEHRQRDDGRQRDDDGNGTISLTATGGTETMAQR